MPPDEQETERSGEEHSGLVPAVVARSADEAEKYFELLKDHDIPAKVATNDAEIDDVRVACPRSMSHGIPVLVPEDMLDEASEVIADREEADEFRVHDDRDEDEGEDDFGLGTEIGPGMAEAIDEEEDLFLDKEDDLEGLDDEDEAL